MADAAASIVHIGENSPEQVAYKLLHMIGQAEKKELSSVGSARVIVGPMSMQAASPQASLH